ncbi:MAG: saccharopine dehydrogenase NADP-binding domain-containing protein [Gammaproteobacteria bacterium]|nr:saccharopine dehydrogenase NADP-binding domain-containing protein [Gammaproteobacteria bacterium]
MINKEFDIVVFGATSFVGKILCEYLVGEHLEPNLSWAMAARSQAKLDELKEELGSNASNIPLIVADSFDEQALQSLCERTHVIISTVGPYALYGDVLIKVCAESGTDYCDLTGEAQWIRRMIAAHEEAAKASGARIINCCGFDSIPSDLGVKFLQQHAKYKFGRCCNKVHMRVKATKGGASGGTIASAINIYKEAAKNPDLRKELRDYYSLCPSSHQNEVIQKSVGLEYDEDFSSWVAPFIMAGINMRIVLRSNAIADEQYASQFEYNEATLTADGREGEKKAKGLARFSRIGPMLLAIPPIRAILTRFFLPKPGQGPSPEEQKAGFFDLRFIGKTEQGDEIKVKVTGDRDPGYGSSAKMLAQAGISLRRDVDKSEIAGGFWTPATAYGDRLIERLQNYAGLSFELQSAIPTQQEVVAEEGD